MNYRLQITDYKLSAGGGSVPGGQITDYKLQIADFY